MLAIMLVVTPIGATTIDFDSSSHGEVLSTQFQGSHGVTFSAVNNSSYHPDKLVAPDTVETHSRDPGL